MAVVFALEVRKRSIASIQRYCADALDRDLGDLQAGLLLDFFLGELVPAGYNAAIADAQAYLREHVSDLEGACYETEFGYWKKR